MKQNLIYKAGKLGIATANKGMSTALLVSKINSKLIKL